ncbi:MAG: hypothetical protein WBL55_02030 [Xanthobacteraceae bacterium]
MDGLRIAAAEAWQRRYVDQLRDFRPRRLLHHDDIAGSPIEYVRAGSEGEHLPAEKKNSIIKYSLWIDSGFNIVAPLMGVSPIVYYAENHVGWKTGGRSGWTAGTVAACSCSSRSSARFRSTTTGLFPN